MRSLLALLAITACGARTDLGAPRPISGTDAGDGGTPPPPSIACVVKEKSVLSKGTTSNADVRIDGAFVYWNDGARIVRVPKTGALTPEVVVDGVVDLGAYDVSPSGVVFSLHGSSQVQRSDGAVLGAVSRPSAELVAASGNRVYVVAPQGKDEALFAIVSGSTQLVALLPLTAADSLGQGQFPQAAYDLVVDGPDAVAFVSLIGHAPLPSKVLSVAIDTGNVATLSAMPLSLPGSTLALDSKYVYYASSFGQGAPAIFAVDRAGGMNPSAVVPTQTYCASCTRAIVASDASRVFFSSGEFGQDVSTWPDQGDPTLVYDTSIDAAVTGIRSDGSCVYWVATGDPNVYVAPVLQ